MSCESTQSGKPAHSAKDPRSQEQAQYKPLLLWNCSPFCLVSLESPPADLWPHKQKMVMLLHCSGSLQQKHTNMNAFILNVLF